MPSIRKKRQEPSLAPTWQKRLDCSAQQIEGSFGARLLLMCYPSARLQTKILLCENGKSQPDGNSSYAKPSGKSVPKYVSKNE
jgi:hypothetical protein